MSGTEQEALFTQLQARLNVRTQRYGMKEVEKLVRDHNRNVQGRVDSSDCLDYWCLLRFHREGILCSTVCSNDHEQDSEDELVQLFASTDDFDFQIMICRWTREPILSAKTINAINRTWMLPYHLWAAMFDNDPIRKYYESRNPEEYGQLTTQCRVLSLGDSHLYVPSAHLGKSKTAILLGFFQNSQAASWSINPNSTKCHKSAPSTSVADLVVRYGDRGIVLWIAEEAYGRKCATGKDFVFLCTEALLREAITRVSRGVTFLDIGDSITHDLDFSVWGAKSWLRHKVDLSACQDVIRNLPDWIDGHCMGTSDGDDNMEERDTILGQYRRQAEVVDRTLDVYKCYIDLSVARTGEKMARGSIEEMKFSKILTVVAVIYLPVSIASSVFGMNIQELNGQGVSITWFFVTIFIALAGVLVCWILFAMLTSQREAIKRRWEDMLHEQVTSESEPRPWVYRLWFIDLTRDRMTEWPGRLYQTLKSRATGSR